MSFRSRLLTSVLLALLVGPVAIGPAPDARSAVRRISVPRTLARATTMSVPERVARVELGLRPTHIAFSWRGGERSSVVYRTVSDAGEVSRWRGAALNHDMEQGRKRFTGVISVDRPTAIEWKRAGRGAMGDVTLHQINTLDGPLRRVLLTAADTSAAAPGAPRIITRAEWGADESLKRTSGGCRRTFFKVQQLFVHHTAGSNSVSDAKATMRAIYHFHTVSRGWCDVGYNFVIDRRGNIYEGRWARRYKPWEIHSSEDSSGRAVAGAHVSGYNSGSVGVSLMGNFQTSPLPPAMRRSLARLLAWEVDRHDLKARGSHLYRNPETGGTRRLPYIAGHRDAGDTSCPGRYLYAALPAIRSDVKAVIGAGKTNTAMSFPLAPADLSYGEPATLQGTLLSAEGAPLGGRSIALWRRVSTERWSSFMTAVTDASGAFSFSFTPEGNMTLVAVYDGDGTTWGSQSTARVKVRPLVGVVPEGATQGGDGVWVYPPGTTSAPLSGTVAPAHKGKTAIVSVARLGPDGTYAEVARLNDVLDASGSFSVLYSPATAGTYSAQAWLPKHRDHARGASEIVYFRI